MLTDEVKWVTWPTRWETLSLCQPPCGSSVNINWMKEGTDMKYVVGDAERLAHGGLMGLLAHKQQNLELAIFPSWWPRQWLCYWQCFDIQDPLVYFLPKFFFDLTLNRTTKSVPLHSILGTEDRNWKPHSATQTWTPRAAQEFGLFVFLYFFLSIWHF